MSVESRLSVVQGAWPRMVSGTSKPINALETEPHVPSLRLMQLHPKVEIVHVQHKASEIHRQGVQIIATELKSNTGPQRRATETPQANRAYMGLITH